MAASPLSNRTFLLAYIACWLSWIFVHAMVLNGFGFDVEEAWLDSIVTNVLLAFTGVMVTISLRFYRPGKNRYSYIFLWSSGVALLCTISVNWLLGMLLDQHTDYLSFLDKSLPVRLGLSFLITGFMAMLSWMWYSIEEQKENESRKSDAEKLAKEAELFKLRQQLQPHFLFNSLNSISALAGTKPEEARKMIQQLSDFLRGTLRKDEQQLVTLKEEIQHLQLYLDIEKVRFGHRLNTSIECSNKTLSMLIPQLLLQPIVENAIKFGLYDTTGSVFISIHAVASQNQLVVAVKNPFDPGTVRMKGTGFGLKSIQRRLYLLYARQDLLETHPEGATFTTIVKIPQQV